MRTKMTNEQRIAFIKKNKGKSIKEMAEMMNVSTATISNWKVLTANAQPKNLKKAKKEERQKKGNYSIADLKAIIKAKDKEIKGYLRELNLIHKHMERVKKVINKHPY